MMSSSVAVLTALRESSKGRLSYKSQLDNDAPTETKKVAKQPHVSTISLHCFASSKDNIYFSQQAFFDDLNTPVMSPEALRMIDDRMKRLSLSSPRQSNDQPHTSSPLTTPHRSLPNGSYRLYLEETDRGESPGVSPTHTIPSRDSPRTSVHGDTVTSEAPLDCEDSVSAENVSAMEEYEQKLKDDLESIDDHFMEEMNESRQ